eukprot:TRINITY_DN80803_c0_g1_i1.p1 TRINITY_DN80803_c0_g1~~TRINITY_DN80803_c0_g1_i1.p1  ORF type:complete len:484 (-),score=113.07 TRINITY_DN80803_c0_g1_i1:102-1553(-)
MMTVYPRTVTALELVDELWSEEEDSTHSGPYFDDGDGGHRDGEGLWVCGLHKECVIYGHHETWPMKLAPRPPKRSKREKKAATSSVVQPQGQQQAEDGDRWPSRQKGLKYIAFINVGMEDRHEDFCLVKRLLGKSGGNVKKLAATHPGLKIRLRGIGSGFLEGSEERGQERREAEMPLRFDVSATDYESYRVACEQLVKLIQELRRHYKRYLRSIDAKGAELEMPEIRVEETRRDDLPLPDPPFRFERSARSSFQDRDTSASNSAPHSLAACLGASRAVAAAMLPSSCQLPVEEASLSPQPTPLLLPVPAAQSSRPSGGCGAASEKPLPASSQGGEKLSAFERAEREKQRRAGQAEITGPTKPEDVASEFRRRLSLSASLHDDEVYDAGDMERRQSLVTDIKAFVRERGPMALTTLANSRSFGARFQKIKSSQSWAEWLLSTPGIRIDENPRKAASYLPSSLVHYEPSVEFANGAQRVPAFPI